MPFSYITREKNSFHITISRDHTEKKTQFKS